MPIIGGFAVGLLPNIFSDKTVSQSSRYLISGVTRDASGNPLGGCLVEVYETVSNRYRNYTISDASGNYAIEIAGDRSITFQAVAYLPGSPDLAGTTINTLVGQ
jgi:hypothetical protein